MAAPPSRLKLLLVVAVGLVGIELGARALHTFVRGERRDEEESWLVPSAELGWRCRPHFAGDVAGVPRAFDGEGLPLADSAQAADGSRRKVVFLGDSNTFGVGVTTERTFVEEVDRLLPEVDAINLGVNGYSSCQGLASLRAIGPRLRPAVVVAAFNFNDRRLVPRPDDCDGEPRFRREHARSTNVWVRADAALEGLYTYRALRRLLQPGRGAERTLRLDEAVARVPPAAYAANLEGIVAEASALGARVVFVELTDHPVETTYLRQGIASLEEGRTSDAESALRAALERGGIHVFLARLWLARLAGPSDPARADLLTVRIGPLSQMGGFPLHVDSEYHAALRAVAARTGVEVVEAWRALDLADYFDRWGHFDARGHAKVAAALAPAIRRALER